MTTSKVPTPGSATEYAQLKALFDRAAKNKTDSKTRCTEEVCLAPTGARYPSYSQSVTEKVPAGQRIVGLELDYKEIDDYGHVKHLVLLFSPDGTFVDFSAFSAGR